MGHNISDRERQTAARATTFASWPRWFVVIRCSRCPRQVTFSTDELAYGYPGVTTLSFTKRLRCRDCRAMPGRVHLVSDRQRDGGRHSVALWP